MVLCLDLNDYHFQKADAAATKSDQWLHPQETNMEPENHLF